MTVTDDLKKQASKSTKWKLGISAALFVVFAALIYTGKKEEAYKVFAIAGEVIAVNSDGDVVASTSPVSVQNVSASTLASATVPNTPAQ